MTTEQYQVNVPGVGPLPNNIQKTSSEEGGKTEIKYAWIKPSPQSGLSNVFIGVLPGAWSLYSRSRGASMFEQLHSDGSFPGIESTDDIRGNRRWILGVFPRNITIPTRRDFEDRAVYFECPGEERDTDTAEFEAWQAVGETNLSYSQIHCSGSTLWDHWRSANYDRRLWSSQNFVLYLAVLILNRDSLASNSQALRDLHGILWRKQQAELNEMMTRRHLSAMAGMAVSGAATFGVGAIASWAYAGYGMIEAPRASQAREARLEHLMEQFPRLRALLQTDET